MFCAFASAVWGVMLLRKPRSLKLLGYYCLTSLVFGLIAMLAVFRSCSDFFAMTDSLTPPKPAQFAAAVDTALSCSLFGLLTVVIQMLVVTIGLLVQTEPTPTGEIVGRH
ncbi:MAG: hypothetical protein R3C49_21555 [Planctomycetaceae bacterium]